MKTVKNLRPIAFVLLAASTAGSCTCKGKPARGKRAAGEVIAAAVEGALPRTDPAARSWEAASEMTVALLPQDVVEPRLLEPGVTQARVRALHDAGWIAFRIEWADPTRDVLVGPGRFSDAAAVQLPTEAVADVTDPAMGMKGRPVAISYWKAAWQEPGDPVAALRPNMPHPAYPAEAARTAADRAVLEKAFAPARGANNPSTTREPGRAVQDLRAEGAGTLTAVAGQSIGRGEWKDGSWRVTIARPLGPPETSPFRPGRRTYVAFAIWNGAARNVGARKMRTVWIPLTLEGK